MLKLLACESHQTQNKRDYQEDTLAYSEAAQVFVVCDGMGGHSGGAAASKAAAEAIVNSDRFPAKNLNENFFLDLGIHVQRTMNMQKIQGGTTIAGFTYNANQLAAFWAGDSRVYLVFPDRNEAMLVTEDENYFHSLVKQGKIDRDNMDFMYEGTKCSLLNSFGFMDLPEAAQLNYRLISFEHAGEVKDFWIVIASDGLNERLNHTDTEAVVAKHYADPKAMAEAAIQSGSKDNISILCLHFEIE